MANRIHAHVRSNVVGYVAIFLFAIGGTAYATHPGGANTISSGDIINEEVRSPDIGPGEVASTDIANDTVSTVDIGTDEVTAADIAAAAVRASEIQTGAVASSEIADGSVTSTDVLDETLGTADLGTGSVGSNEIVDESIEGADIHNAPPFGSGGFNGDVEILDGTILGFDVASNTLSGSHIANGSLAPADTEHHWAVVESDCSLARASSGAVTSSDAGANDCVVDFAQDISSCAWTGTIGLTGQSGVSAPGEITTVGAAAAAGEGVFVSTYNSAGAEATLPFHLNVSCVT